ncbi:MAG TPA: hypothetical protein VD713_03440 [Sphingomonadales bacterium]|nr:hypothetical protein [Sphingomonadales bacterium]
MSALLFSRVFRFLALAAALAVLSSCGQKRGMGIVKIPNCPAVGIVGHAGSLTRFNGEGVTSGDVAFDAAITDVDSTCVEGPAAIETTVSFSIIARKGPALQNPAQPVRYFVVVLRDDYQVTNKRSFTAELRFAPGQDKAALRETFVQRFDDITAAARYRYEVLIGFELSPEEIKFTTIR